MSRRMSPYLAAMLMLGLGISARAQVAQERPPLEQSQEQARPQEETPLPAEQKRDQKKSNGAAKDIGSGAADAGKGAAKGTGELAKGTAKGAGDLVTLHPIDAGAAVGRGAVVAGKDVTVGTVKGAGKMTRGVGKALKKVF